jgi:hypothetical protein
VDRDLRAFDQHVAVRMLKRQATGFMIARRCGFRRPGVVFAGLKVLVD